MRKFKALVNEFSLDDGGVASFTFEVQSLYKDKIYEEYKNGWVRDDNGCSRDVDSKEFKNKFVEIKTEK